MIRRFSAGLVAALAALSFGATLAHAIGFSPDGDIAAENPDPAPITTMKHAAPEQYPARLVIPSLEVDAQVQYVGITSHGTMSVPTNFTDVGWYKYGSVPGTAGSAVFAGHVDNALALPGVFKRLGDITVGADIYVLQKNGSKLHFVVDDVETYPAAQAPVSRIFDSSGTSARLNLITCEGSWIQSQHQYDHRLVVYSHLVGGVPAHENAAPESGVPQSQPDVPAPVPSIPMPDNQQNSADIPEYPALPETSTTTEGSFEATSTIEQNIVQ